MSRRVLFRSLRRRWYYATHDKGRVPWCWDCRLFRGAQKLGDWYYHDEPRWMIEEAFRRARPVTIVTHKPGDITLATWADGTGQNWWIDPSTGETRRRR